MKGSIDQKEVCKELLFAFSKEKKGEQKTEMKPEGERWGIFCACVFGCTWALAGTCACLSSASFLCLSVCSSVNMHISFSVAVRVHAYELGKRDDAQWQSRDLAKNPYPHSLFSTFELIQLVCPYCSGALNIECGIEMPITSFNKIQNNPECHLNIQKILMVKGTNNHDLSIVHWRYIQDWWMDGWMDEWTDRKKDR